MSKHSISIGRVELLTLTDGYGSGKPTDVFPESTETEWEEYKEFLANLPDDSANVDDSFGKEEEMPKRNVPSSISLPLGILKIPVSP